MSKPVIETQDLTVYYGKHRGIKGVNLTVEQGEVFGFLGPNGAGKTTTIRMMLGLLQPTAGEIEVLGIAMSNHPERIRPRIGYMSQRFSLYNDLTVLQNLRFYGRAYGLENDVLEERIREALRMTNLEGREYTHTKDLSGGWRQRLALNAAILHRPELIFLDEPTAGVDPVSRRAFWDLLYKLIAEGITVFVTTHYMDEAEHCNTIAMMHYGHLIAMGSPDELKATRMQGTLLELDCDPVMPALDVLPDQPGIREVAIYGVLLHVVTEDPAEQAIPRITALLESQGIAVRHLVPILPSLEDVFVSMVEAHDRSALRAEFQAD